MLDEEKFLDSLVPIFLPKLARGDENYCLIQAPFNQDAPVTPYATFQVIDLTEIGQLEEGIILDEGQVVRRDVDVTVRITTYGKGAITTAKAFHKCLEYPSMAQSLTNVDTAWRENTPVINLTPLIKTKYQERATFDVVLGTVCIGIDEDIVPIEKVKVEQSVNDTCDPVDTRLINTITIE
jgi:hypothetical protein